MFQLTLNCSSNFHLDKSNVFCWQRENIMHFLNAMSAVSYQTVMQLLPPSTNKSDTFPTHRFILISLNKLLSFNPMHEKGDGMKTVSKIKLNCVHEIALKHFNIYCLSLFSPSSCSLSFEIRSQSIAVASNKLSINPRMASNS